MKADPTLTNQSKTTKERNQGKTKKSAPEFPSWERQSQIANSGCPIQGPLLALSGDFSFGLRKRPAHASLERSTWRLAASWR